MIASTVFAIAILSFAAGPISRDFQRQSAYLGLLKEVPPEVAIDCNSITERRSLNGLKWSAWSSSTRGGSVNSA
jgi:hypothetical protein